MADIALEAARAVIVTAIVVGGLVGGRADAGRC